MKIIKLFLNGIDQLHVKHKTIHCNLSLDNIFVQLSLAEFAISQLKIGNISLNCKCMENQQNSIPLKLPMSLEDHLKNIYYPPELIMNCLLYTSPSPRDRQKSRMPSSA
eukprot:TRINITY_DN16504_c0_g1_i1.p1 TRINITY_DN16504_c0_g1~~TRINITY_DN16504_c0_g1_i1.p1  ORF type:complete len:109 (-),score=16.03 TRINITY_DN16504_c0_g1_i1:35-361(-)